MRNHANLPPNVRPQLFQLMRNILHPQIFLLLQNHRLRRNRLPHLPLQRLNTQIGVIEIAENGVTLLHPDPSEDVVDHFIAAGRADFGVPTGTGGNGCVFGVGVAELFDQEDVVCFGGFGQPLQFGRLLFVVPQLHLLLLQPALQSLNVL